MPNRPIPPGMELVQEAGKEIWERLPKETDMAWKYFMDFRDMGESRSAGQVARLNNVTDGCMSIHRHRWWWDQRVAAYDAKMEYPPQPELDSRAMYARELHGVADELIKLGRQVLKHYKKKRADSIELRDAIGCIKLSQLLDQYARKSGDAQAEAEDRRLNEEIESVFGSLTRGVAELVSGGPLEAEAKTGRGFGIKRNARNRSTGLREIQADAGEVCSDGVEADMDS